MTALGLGDIAAFPFVEPPDRRQVKDGVALLEELGALDPAQPDVRKRLTPLGRRLAQLPVDPRIGRMVLEADRNGCLPEVLVIAAALSIQDPRERPPDQQQAADEKHRRFADDRSDFLAYRNLWLYLQEQQTALSSSAFRRLCRAEFLHYLRVREWQDLVGQLRQVCRSLGLATTGELSAPGDDPQPVHVSLLAGLLSHLGLYEPEKREYLGARGARFAAWPGSALFRKPPRWVMAGELVETSRLWGRDLGRIEPEWVEPLAEHLVKRSYSEPHWSAKQGAAMAYEKVTLYGVPLVAARKVAYGRIDPSRLPRAVHPARAGAGRVAHPPPFLPRQPRAAGGRRGARAPGPAPRHPGRRRDAGRLLRPAAAGRGRLGPALRRLVEEGAPGAARPAHLRPGHAGARRGGPGERPATTPTRWTQGELALPLSYQFEPGAAADGVTVHVPLTVLNRLTPDGFDWQVPGLRLDLAVALVRSLPKPLRRNLVPAPDTARAALQRIGAGSPAEPFTEALARQLRAVTAVDLPPEAWQLDRVPDHLRLTFRVEDGDGAVVAEGKDLRTLQDRLAPTVRRTVSSMAVDVERAGLTSWSFGALPATFSREVAGRTLRGYPALVDEGDTVGLRVLGSEREARAATRAGVRRLLTLTVPSPLKGVVSRLDNASKLALGHNPDGSVPALLDDCVAASLDVLVDSTAASRPTTRRSSACGRPSAPSSRRRRTTRWSWWPASWRRPTRCRGGSPAARVRRCCRPGSTCGPSWSGWCTRASSAPQGCDRLGDLVRYLTAVQRRLDALAVSPARDRERLARVEVVEREHAGWLAGLRPERRTDGDVLAVRWMLEELRVSLFAQQLGTPYPVSEKRIYRAMDAVAP